MVDPKNVIIAILVAYVVLDLCTAIVLKRSRPLLVKHLSNVFKKDKNSVGACLGIAILAGLATYAAANNFL